jgi:glycosyltransferase involved in cell wall biosynthesis
VRVAFCTHYPISAIFGDEVSAPQEGEHPFPWVRLLARALIEGGHLSSLDVLTHSPLYPRDEVVVREKVTFHIFARQDRLELPPVRLRGFRVAWAHALWRLVRCLRTLGPDVVHAHGTDDVYGLAAVLCGRPHLVSLQGLMAFIGRAQPTSRSRALQWMERQTIVRARALNAKTPGVAAYARRLNARAGVVQIEDAIAEDFFASPVPAARPTLRFVGELLPRKGVEAWIEAFVKLAARHGDLRGTIVGSGPSEYQRHLRKLLGDAGVDGRVVLAGPLSASDIARGHAEGGVFCLPSFAEHCPNAVMEAMAAGLPVVASRVGDVHHLVEAERSGLLVGAPDPVLIAEAVSRLLDRPRWHESLGRRGRQIALERWRADRCAREHVQLYRRLAPPR